MQFTNKDAIMSAKYVIGIDLGTTNSVLAYAPLGKSKTPDPFILSTFILSIHRNQ